MTSKNRRRHLRTRSQNLVAHLRVGDRTVVAPVEDISIAGAFLRTAEPIGPGTVLAFDVARPGLKRPLRLMGLVVDHRPGKGVALRFDGLDHDTVVRLVELLRDLGGVVAAAPEPVPAAQPGGAPFQTVPRSNPTLTANHDAAATGPVGQGTEDGQRLMVQLRGAIMEIGNLQQQLVQKDRELLDLKEKHARVEGEARQGGKAEALLGKLEVEKQRLEAQLAEARGRSRAEIDAVRREADAVLVAMSRLVEALKRLG